MAGRKTTVAFTRWRWRQAFKTAASNDPAGDPNGFRGSYGGVDGSEMSCIMITIAANLCAALPKEVHHRRRRVELLSGKIDTHFKERDRK